MFLLCGAIMPLWHPLQQALRSTCTRVSQRDFLPVKKCELGGRSIVGVELSGGGVEMLKKTLAAKDGGTFGVHSGLNSALGEMDLARRALSGRPR